MFGANPCAEVAVRPPARRPGGAPTGLRLGHVLVLRQLIRSWTVRSVLMTSWADARWRALGASISAVIVVTIGNGCTKTDRGHSPPSTRCDTLTTPVRLESSDRLAGKSPAELFDEAAVAAAEFMETERTYRTSGGQFRAQPMRRQLETQLAAYRLIETHALSTSEQRVKSILGQVDLLSVAVDQGWLNYGDELTALRDRLATEE